MNRKLIDQWQKDRDEVIELLDIETISEGTKKRAAEWLEANNFTKGIWR